jgi:hypothetical protein
VISTALAVKICQHRLCLCDSDDKHIYKNRGIYCTWSLVWLQYLHLTIPIKRGEGPGGVGLFSLSRGPKRNEDEVTCDRKGESDR